MLKFDDFGGIEATDSSQVHSNRFKQIWNNVILAGSKYPLLKSFVISFKWNILIFLILNTFTTFISNFNVLIMKEILGFIEGDYSDKDRAVKFVMIMIMFEIFSVVISNKIGEISQKFARLINVSLMGLIYSKIYKISESNKKYSKGTISNIIQSDSTQVQLFVWMLPWMYNTPLGLIINLFTLYTLIGTASIVSLIILLIFSAIIYYGRKFVQDWNMRRREQMDIGSDYYNELIENIKVIKMNSLIDCYIAKILDYKKKLLYKDILFHLFWIINRLILTLGRYMLIFGVFIVLIFFYDIPVGAAAAITIVKVLEKIKDSMSSISDIYSYSSNITTSVKRIEDFMKWDEMEEFLISRSNSDETKESIEIKNGNFFWGFDHISEEEINEFKKNKSSQNIEKSNKVTLSDRITLKSINLSIKKGEFVAIIGGVGSGKSSLLNCILGEMLYLDDNTIDKFKDSALDFSNDLEESKKTIDVINKYRKDEAIKSQKVITVNGTVSLIEQKPFILSKTIRENILFGEELNPDKYNRIVRSWQLGRDFEILDGGDLTEIGERGINVSGGQKARISIARAVYADSDIVLMDDPLSALDAHVKRKIFDQVWCKELKNKTRLLVTHAVEFLDRVDRILMIEDGKIILDGTFNQLKDTHNFKTIVESMGKYDENENNNEENKEEIEDSEQEESLKNYLSTTGTKIIDSVDEENVNVSLNSYFNYATYLKIGAIALIICSGVGIIENCLEINQEHSIIQWVKTFSQNKEVNIKSILIIIIFTASRMGTSVLKDCIESFQKYVIDNKIFKEMINKVLNASIPLFFDKTQSGKIISRFNTDLENAGSILSSCILQFLDNIWSIGVTFYYVAQISPSSLGIMPISIVMFLYISKDYFRTSKEISRIKQAVSSPSYSHINESIDGISTIRAFKKSYMFEDTYGELQDREFIVSTISSSLGTWLQFRLGFVSLLFTSYYYYNWINTKDGQDPVLIGLMIGYLVSLQEKLQGIIPYISTLNSYMVSFERWMNIWDIPQEAEQRLPIPNSEDNEKWISKGRIQLCNYSLKYRPDLDLILKNLNVEIKAREKVGIVGRTGAGKSTLILAIWRVVEAYEGKILIDGVDISQVGLADLRDRVTVIPQEPVLFNNTLRFNLDPDGKHKDEEIINLLERASIEELLARDGNGLDFKITEGGSNLSAGEKAIICICRAILRKNKIVLVDEATASTDVNTEEIIQKLFHEEFKESTVLTVAHRLNTIINSDKIMVMHFGEIIEYDSPENLKRNPNSAFSELLNQFNS